MGNIHAFPQPKAVMEDQRRLLLMLYDGALASLSAARVRMRAHDFAGKGILISKTIDIISELAASLKTDEQDILARSLSNLYLLCTAKLLRANLKMDMEALDSVVSILSRLRDAYARKEGASKPCSPKEAGAMRARLRARIRTFEESVRRQEDDPA